MKLIAACIISVFLAIGCATTGAVQQPPPAGCEGSWLWEHQTEANLLLWSGVAAMHVMSQEQPAYYTLASSAAKQAANLLRSKPVTLAEFSMNNYLKAFAPLVALIPVDRVLCPFERELLASWLDQV
jgi:hypothetical protein